MRVALRRRPRFYARLQRDLVAASRRRAGGQQVQSVTRQQRLRARPLAATALVAVGAVGAIVVVSAGSGTSKAVAGWTAKPRQIPSAQSVEAQTACLVGLAETAARPGGGPGRTRVDAQTAAREWQPVLVDSRGPYTLALFQRGNTVARCLAGPSGGNAISLGSASTAPVPAGHIVVDDSYGGGPVGGPQTTAIEGRVAADVTGVSLKLSDGTTVQTTVSNGWFVAWWPSNAQAQSADIVSSDQPSSTQALQQR